MSISRPQQICCAWFYSLNYALVKTPVLSWQVLDDALQITAIIIVLIGSSAFSCPCGLFFP